MSHCPTRRSSASDASCASRHNDGRADAYRLADRVRATLGVRPRGFSQKLIVPVDSKFGLALIYCPSREARPNHGIVPNRITAMVSVVAELLHDFVHLESNRRERIGT